MIQRLLIIVFILGSFNAFAQTNILKGRVIDQEGRGIASAHIIYEELPGAVTDSVGKFSIDGIEVNKLYENNKNIKIRINK